MSRVFALPVWLHRIIKKKRNMLPDLFIEIEIEIEIEISLLTKSGPQEGIYK
jgi:hypothetical protein